MSRIDAWLTENPVAALGTRLLKQSVQWVGIVFLDFTSLLAWVFLNDQLDHCDWCSL